MDTKKDAKIAHCGESENCRLIVGTKQIRKALSKGIVHAVFLAKNADPAITDPIRATCDCLHIPCTWVATMDELGRSCGIEVGASAAAVAD